MSYGTPKKALIGKDRMVGELYWAVGGFKPNREVGLYESDRLCQQLRWIRGDTVLCDALIITLPFYFASFMNHLFLSIPCISRES